MQSFKQKGSNTDRIAGGSEAVVNSWPWIAHIRFGLKKCGGTILNEKTILTAAHCCYGYEYLGSFIIKYSMYYFCSGKNA